MQAKAKSWFRPLARAGYAARGLIYLVIGFLAALAAFGSGETVDTRGALDRLLSSGAGTGLAVVLVVGLFSYALWRLIQSVFDTDDHGTDAKGLAIRGGLLVSGFVYAALGLYAASLARGAGGGGGGGFAESFAGVVGSRLAAAIIAAAFAGAGIAHIIKAVRGTYERHLQASKTAMRVIHPVARTGLVARGAVFLVLAFLFGWRAATASGESSPGSREALEFIQQLPFGGWLLALTGLGLVAFAAYSFTEAIYRRINVEDASAPASVSA